MERFAIWLLVVGVAGVWSCTSGVVEEGQERMEPAWAGDGQPEQPDTTDGATWLDGVHQDVTPGNADSGGDPGTGDQSGQSGESDGQGGGQDQDDGAQEDLSAGCQVGGIESCITECGSQGERPCDEPDAPCEPPEEDCNGVDDDCDGTVDQDIFGQPLFRHCEDDGTHAGEEPEVCYAGYQVCEEDHDWSECQGTVYPTDEICDGIDNDCDDLIDEDLGTTTCGIGPCENTIDNCLDGELQDCVPLVGSPEVCDLIDNDCDGSVDEGLGKTTCGKGVCKNTVDNCVNGVVQICVPLDGGAEVCDNLDNDCDGKTDEKLAIGCSCAGQVGAYNECVNGQYTGCPAPQSGSKKVNIPELEPDCPFGQGSNLNPKGGKAAARVEQWTPINLPEGTILCSMEIISNTSEFYYDDHFVLALNDTVLMTSWNALGEFPKVNGLPQYEWSAIKGDVLSGSHKCINGATQCSLPGTEEQGSVALAFTASTNEKLMTLAGQDGYYGFLLVAVGDDNPDVDCYHSGLKLKVKYTYY